MDKQELGRVGLVKLSKREAIKKDMGFYLIDDDQFRKFYPYYDEIMAKCPEYSTVLTAIGSGPVTPKILKYASDNGFNFIFDGTMKNPRILNTANGWKDYNISYKIMATSRIESLISIFERNAYLRRNGFGRPISVKAHDETYYGLPDTLKILENSDNPNIEIYVRGENETYMPKLIYSSDEKGIYGNAVEALEKGRIKDKKRCIACDVQDRILNLETSDIGLDSNEYEALQELKDAVRKEVDSLELY